MKITDININLLEKDNSKIRGIVSIVIDNCFIIHGIKIIDSINGLFVAMPSKKDDSGIYNDIVYPINSSTREIIQSIILNEYNRLMEEN